MQKLTKFIHRLLILIILAIGIIFTIYNRHEVLVYMMFFDKHTLPLYQVILISFVSGVIITWLLLLPGMYSKHRKIKRQIKTNKKLEKENTKLETAQNK